MSLAATKKKERGGELVAKKGRKEGTGRPDPDGTGARVEGRSERGGSQTGSAWKRKQRGSLIHRGLYQNLVTSEAKATAKEER